MTRSKQNRVWSIAAKILGVGRAYPHHPALTVDDEIWTYSELIGAASFLASNLGLLPSLAVQRVTAVMAHRHPASYVGILATLLKGHAYVPVNLSNPVKQNIQVLIRSGTTEVICDSVGEARLLEIKKESPQLFKDLKIIRCGASKKDYSRTIWVDLRDEEVDANALAYILFTSGSTGEPKGVPISHSNLTHYLDAIKRLVDLGPDDRVSQTFELSFDLSVHDLMLTWTHGANLIVPQACDFHNLAEFITEYALTCWFSVPTLAYQIKLQGQLTLNQFPHLKWSLFCGEALPKDLTILWKHAAPNCKLLNLYGPTEATIACGFFEVTDAYLEAQNSSDVIPIGFALQDMDFLVCDEDINPCPEGVAGELILHGSQVASGYLNDPEKTAKNFIYREGSQYPCYKTGDKVMLDASGCIQFLGRLDFQIKINGFRIELQAIESFVRTIYPATNVVAMAWPPEGRPLSIVLVVESLMVDVDVITQSTRQSLPEYMVPSRVILMEKFPTNSSGKTDRIAIIEYVKKSFKNRLLEIGLYSLNGVAKALLKTLLEINPTLDETKIFQSKTLFEAGLDSLGFINFTVSIEKFLGKTLTQEQVVDLADSSFSSIIDTIEMIKNSASPQIKGADLVGIPINSNRVNRVFQFIDRFPKYLDTSEVPLALAVGSSGIFRAFNPKVFDAISRQHGVDIRSSNIGLPAIDMESIMLICKYIAEQCKSKKKKVSVIVYEIDPMLVSSLPPKGDVKLHAHHFSGVDPAQLIETPNDEFTWSLTSSGCPPSISNKRTGTTVPQWQSIRQQDIYRTYQGQVPFLNEQIHYWIRGGEYLKEIADRVVVFVHPLSTNRTQLEELSVKHAPDLWMAVVDRLKSVTGIEFIESNAYQLTEDDFMDINHVNASGQSKLTKKISEGLFSEQPKFK